MQSAEGKDEVVVSVGGGAVGAPLLNAAIAARPKTSLSDRSGDCLSARMPERPCGAADERGVVVEPARAISRRSSQRHAVDLPGGYNTDLETLGFADRAVIVPFATERETEQTRRTEVLAERGMVAMVSPGTLSAQAWPTLSIARWPVGR